MTLTARKPVALNSTDSILELDLRRYELRRSGRVLKLERQPMELLILLAEHPGELVTRDEIVKRLWADGIYVDTERGINNAIRKLRFALHDDPEHPRYLETVIGKGYRLLAPVKITPRSEPAAMMSAAVAASAPTSVASKPRRRLGIARTWLITIIVVVIVTGVGAGWWWRTRNPDGAYVVAVLPFKNLSSEPNSDYFSDGLTDEVIRNLSIIEGLQVRSRTSSFAFKDKPRNIAEVGRQLRANLVLEGSVLRSGTQLRIDAQLIRVSDDVPLWSGRYDRELKDIFLIQDEISRAIVNELRLKNVGGQRRYNTNLEAYELYLKARALGGLSNQYPAQLRQGIGLYQQVIAKDPNFAPAYAGLAKAYANLSISPPHFDAVFADVQMRTAAEKALQLDPLLPEAYEAMGLVYARELAWADAEKDFRHALQLNRNLSMARLDLVMNVLHPMGRFDEGALELKKTLELDPLSLQARRQMALLLLSAHRYDEALEYSRQVAALDANDFYGQQFTGRALMGKGKFSESIAIFERLGENGQQFLGYAYVKVGRRAEAKQIIARNQGWPARQAVIYAALDDNDHAFEALEQMAAMKDFRVDIYPFFPEMSSLRSDPRMKEFRRRRGLTWNP